MVKMKKYCFEIMLDGHNWSWHDCTLKQAKELFEQIRQNIVYGNLTMVSTFKEKEFIFNAGKLVGFGYDKE